MSDKVKKKNINKANIKKEKDKHLIYNSQHSFKKFEDINEFKELSLDFMFKKLNDFKKGFNKFKTVNPQTDENNALKPKVLDNVGNLFNELYYIYKDKYNEERDGSNKKKQKTFLLQKN